MSGRSVTELLEAHRAGNEHALDQAFSIVYDELRGLARYQLRDGRRKSLNTTALVHELYLKLAASEKTNPANRAHFLSLASRAMRQIVVDWARARATGKRGGHARRVTLDEDRIEIEDQAEWILALHQALGQIRKVDERLEQVFECRYFAGLSEQETANALGVSVATVQRDWRRAKAWLRETLDNDD